MPLSGFWNRLDDGGPWQRAQRQAGVGTDANRGVTARWGCDPATLDDLRLRSRWEQAAAHRGPGLWTPTGKGSNVYSGGRRTAKPTGAIRAGANADGGLCKRRRGRAPTPTRESAIADGADAVSIVFA